MNVLQSTGFNALLSRRTEKEESGPEVVREEEENIGEDGVAEDTPTVVEIETEGENSPEEDVVVLTVTPAAEDDSVPEEPVLENTNLRNAKLYFVDVDDSGSISLQAVIRPVQFHDSPLTETMRALLSGLLPSELNRELLTLIPDNSNLLSVRVDNGIAYTNFNEAFRFNSLGIEGYSAQLKQIVYTATEFSTVESVQILIEGNKYDYLGPEGVFIGQPLTRSSFH